MGNLSESIVLVVDDEPNIVRLCRRLLEKANFQVVTATSQAQSLAILASQRVDLLLVEVRMSGLDVFQLISLARRHQPDLSAVIMTGYGTLDTAIAALQQGADGLILKPIAGDELVQNVQRAMQENQRKQDVARLRALRPLFDITETLFTETDPSRLHHLIADAICRHLDCSISGIYKRKTTSRQLVLLACRGESTRISLEDPANKALRKAISRNIPLWVNWNGPGEPELQALLVDFKLGSLICVPVSHNESSYVLKAARQPGEPVFREVDLEILLILARQAIASLENARLYTELRSYIRRIEKSQTAMINAEKSAAAGRLTASIAHEINNPLQSLNNCLHLAGRKELSSQERQKYLTLAQTELDRLMSTVQRMLEFYRPGVRDRQLSNVNELVKRVLLLLEQQLQKSGIQVNLKFTSNLPMVPIVVNQIQQVLLNLLLNAIEALPGGGEISIETVSSKSGVDIVVEDTGPGFPEVEREQIFEPFISTKENGTGLGLAVSYGIVVAHGGTLRLENGSGKGACFRITLPEEELYESENISS